METKTKKPLLALNSPTYLRRMARELNALPDGFYHDGKRWNAARCSSMPGEGGKFVTLHISRPSEFNHNARHSTAFSDLSAVTFSDAYGRTVTASRHS